ncbi:MAG: hypothetical protein ABI658_13065 [Acidimicrobiales bacterium]
MSPMLEATKTNAKDAALVAFGVPVVLFDRVSDQLNARLHLDSYVGLAREHAERALDGYRVRLQHLVGGVQQIVPGRHRATPIVEAAPAAAAPPVAEARTKRVPTRKVPTAKAPGVKAAAKKSVRPATATRR